MSPDFAARFTEVTASSIPIYGVTAKAYKAWLKAQPAATVSWLENSAYEPEPGRLRLIPGAKGSISGVVICLHENFNLWHWAALAQQLPATHEYVPAGKLSAEQKCEAALGWLLGGYQFTRYKPNKKAAPKLALESKYTGFAKEMAESIYLIRDLVNTPANDMGPSQLAEACRTVAKANGANFSQIVGDDLLAKNYPTIHAVGRAAKNQPRLIELHWGNAKHPKLTLVGKGVCFDTGGLNIKTGSGMALMKKDMAGAAFALGLAQLIIRRKLPVRLRVLIPAVENSVGADAFRPQDIIKTRKGITVEIGNTDAEGRLILCDALTEADREKPDMMLDFATLTGASRIALGPDIPSFFTPDDGLAQSIGDAAVAECDPLWRLPLWQDYESFLQSAFADTDNAGGSYAGAIVAALFLKKFVTSPRWLHIDMMGWNIKDRPGRPLGGEAQGLRSIYRVLEARYTK